MSDFAGAIAKLRSTTAGELAWVLGLTVAVTVHAASLTSAFLRPDLVDFGAFVDNARAWANGSPYPQDARDPNTPHVLLLFVPFTDLPLRVGLAIWMAMSYACAGIAVRLVLKETGYPLTGAALLSVLAILAISPPILGEVKDGNMLWPLWLAFTIAWMAERGGRTATGGLLMGLLISVKPFLALWFLYWVARRRWAAIGAAALGLVASLVVGIAVTGPAAWTAWRGMLDRITWYDSGLNASIPGFAARVTGDPYGTFGLAIAFLVAAMGAWWWWWRRHRNFDDVDFDWLVVFMTAMLLSPLGWRYYYCFALGPALVVFRRTPRWQAMSVAGLALLPAWDLRGEPILLQATLGSIPFWALLGAWMIVLGGGPTHGNEKNEPNRHVEPGAHRRRGFQESVS